MTPTYHKQLSVLDPFARVNEEALFENILEHLSGGELLKLSEVSHRHDDILSGSRRCLDKIALVVNEETISSDYSDFQRDYRHLRVGDSQNMRKTEESSKLKNRKLIELLHKFSSSLISIEVKSNLISDDTVFEGTMDNLEDLKVMVLNRFIAELIPSAPKLKSLTIGSTILSHSELLTFIKNYESIEELHMKFNIFDRLFSNDISQAVNLKLKKLEIQKNFMGRTVSDENLEKFLLAQAGTLREIVFKSVAHSPTINLIFKDLSLNKLTINSLDEWANLNPKPNMCVTELVIRNDANCATLLKASPNLRKFHVYKLTKVLVTFLATSMWQVTHVTYSECDSENVQMFYVHFIRQNPNQRLNTRIVFEQLTEAYFANTIRHTVRTVYESRNP